MAEESRSESTVTDTGKFTDATTVQLAAFKAAVQWMAREQVQYFLKWVEGSENFGPGGNMRMARVWEEYVGEMNALHGVGSS